MNIQLPSRGFWIKFILFDFIFGLTFYLTLVYTFPLNKIIQANQKVINQKAGRTVKFKSAKLDFGLNIVLEGIKISDVHKALLSKKDLKMLTLYKEIAEYIGESEKDLKAAKEDIIAYLKKKKIDLSVLAQKNRVNLTQFKKDWVKFSEMDGKGRLNVKKLTISPDISSMISGNPMLTFKGKLLGGTLSGTYKQIILKTKSRSKRKRPVKKRINHELILDIEQFSGEKLSTLLALRLPLTGFIGGHLGLQMDAKFKNIAGIDFDLSFDDGKIGPGPMYLKKMKGDVTLPMINMGSFTLVGSSKGNKITLKPLKLLSSDLEAQLDGYISTGRKMRPNLKLKYKLTDTFLNNPDNKKIANVVRAMGSAKRKDGFFGYLIVGTLDKLKFKKYKR